MPEGILHGIPYRTTQDGWIEAVTPGGHIILKDLNQLATFAAGGTIESLSLKYLKDYPKELNGYHYRVVGREIFALTPFGAEVRYPNWRSFWDAAQRHQEHRQQPRD